jgi:hypothetical protein
MVKVVCNSCNWKGDLSTCGKIEIFDAARCPHCREPVVAYKILQQVREERRAQKQRRFDHYVNVLPKETEFME